MKAKISNILFFVLICIVAVSCRSYGGGAFGASTDIDPITTIDSNNKYDLVVSSDGIEYTIDVSTPDGRLMLKDLSLKQAQQLVNAEAARKHNCAMIVRPKYTYLRDGKQLLRITVFGFPANYKNSEKK